MKLYTLFIIGLVSIMLQGCFCKHYPFEKLKSEVGEPLHKQIMEYKKRHGTYPYEKDKKAFGEFIKSMGCQFQSRAEIYPEGNWKCGENIYTITFWYCTGYNYCRSDKSGFDQFNIGLGEFTDCRYQYKMTDFNYISCNYAPCWSRFTH